MRKTSTLASRAALGLALLPAGAPLLHADAGPIVNVNVPNGSYRVDATFHGQTETRVVTLRGRDSANLYFWTGVPKAAAS